MSPSDADVVSEIRQGNRDAFSEIVRRYQRPLFGLVLMVVRDAAGAEEVTQDAFVRAFAYLDAFDERRSDVALNRRTCSTERTLTTLDKIERGRARYDAHRKYTAFATSEAGALRDAGFSYAEIAKRLGVSRSYAFDLATGRRPRSAQSPALAA